jgi:hypothetical protein
MGKPESKRPLGRIILKESSRRGMERNGPG